MKVIIFGATGMVGQGVLREALADPTVERVLSVARGPSNKTDPKLKELRHENFADFSGIADALTGYDACFYCIGVTSMGMNETDYTRITHDYTMAAASVLAAKNPKMTFVFVSASGADSSEKGSVMWARVKGRTENDLQRLPFKDVHSFRPAYIQPMHGIKSRTKLYRALAPLVAPLYPVWKRACPAVRHDDGDARSRDATRGEGRRAVENPRDPADQRVGRLVSFGNLAPLMMIGRELFAREDEPMAQIVRRQANRYTVANQHPDVKPAQPARKLGGHEFSVGQLHGEATTRERLGHYRVGLN